MDWSSLVPIAIRYGGTAIGSMLGGPVGGVIADLAGRALADKLKVEPTPEATKDALDTLAKTDPEAVKAIVAGAETEALARKAEFEFMAEQARQQGENERAEIAAGRDLPDGWLRNIVLFLNAIWRPLYAIEGLIECAAFAVILGRVISSIFFGEGGAADLSALGVVVPILQPILMIYIPARFAIIGYQMKLRTDEKKANMVAAGGGIDAAVIGGIIAAVLPTITRSRK